MSERFLVCCAHLLICEAVDVMLSSLVRKTRRQTARLCFAQRLCPVPAGTAIVRDVRTLHSGTPNLATRTRFLPSVEFVSADYRARGKGSVFPPTKSLSQKFFDGLQPEIQELCKELVLPKGEKLLVTYTKK